MEDEYDHNEALDLDENLLPVQVEEDETFHGQDLHMTDSNGEEDQNDGVEGLAEDYEFKLEDYLV